MKYFILIVGFALIILRLVYLNKINKKPSIFTKFDEKVKKAKLNRVILAYTPEEEQNKKPNIFAEFDEKVNKAKLNREILANTPEEEKHELIYFYIQKLVRKDDYKYETIMNLPAPLKTFYLIDQFEKEVNNGGFLQFFSNSSGQFTEETLNCLFLINARNTAKMLEDAIQCIKKHNETPVSLRQPLFDLKPYEIHTDADLYSNKEMMAELNEIDNEFYSSKEYLYSLLLNYFNNNLDKIFDNRQ